MSVFPCFLNCTNGSKSRKASHIIYMIVLQEELPIILIVEITHETQMKGHQTHKNINNVNTLKRENINNVNTLEVQCKPQNVVDKYAVCFKNGNGATIGHLRKGKSGRFAKTRLY